MKTDESEVHDTETPRVQVQAARDRRDLLSAVFIRNLSYIGYWDVGGGEV